jgi:FdhE protein
VLWCAQCGTAWEFERVRCACCGTQNHEHLHYEGIEGDEAHQLHVCDECGARVPTVFVGNDLAPFSYEVEEVVSARLAALAQA